MARAVTPAARQALSVARAVIAEGIAAVVALAGLLLAPWRGVMLALGGRATPPVVGVIVTAIVVIGRSDGGHCCDCGERRCDKARRFAQWRRLKAINVSGVCVCWGKKRKKVDASPLTPISWVVSTRGESVNDG